ncbi:UPF0488 protein CG14286 [Pseudomyrmex gracilis]|uniref:UPF0488 protein CG14286 n=1 Tax=Pseudomyrmex gracilis TaxID=219809 RepID=UPI000995B142|nr:UPF0488 protein CG14286 [Pseudomyrmex gracilis]
MPSKPAMISKHNSKSKKNAPTLCVPPVVTEDENKSTGLNSEVEDQFELELCWCIQQLEACLGTGKLQNKQAQDLNKQIQMLKSNTAPLIKKRQIMRNTLGDYRKKMAEDEQKFKKLASTVKFADPALARKTIKKSIFLKKAVQHNAQEHEGQVDDQKVQDSDGKTMFQFNFELCK